MTPSSDDLKIPKTPVTVELDIAGEGIRHVQVFVAEHRAGSRMRQRVLDMLESEPQFMPAVEHGVPRVFNKATLRSVTLPLVDGSLPVEEDIDGDLEGGTGGTLYDIAQPVTLVLEGGAELEGDLLYSPPPEQARVVDYLNRGGHFLRVWCSDRIVLVNKNRLISVVERPQDTARGEEKE